MENSEKVKSVRTALNMTLEGFGKQIGVGKSLVSMIEKGKKPATERVINDIIRVYNVNLSWWQSGTPPMFAEGRAGPEMIRTAANRIVIEGEPILTELIHEMMKLPKSKQARYLADLIAETEEDQNKQEGKDGNKHSGNK